jgi:hypothetical protein
VERFICTQCGTQFSESTTPPPGCPLCDVDGRQPSVEWAAWTTLCELRSRHHNLVQPIESNLLTIRSTPSLRPGRQALLLRSPGGNVLWDSLTLLDDVTIRQIRGLGGIVAIAVSHPRHVGSAVEWSKAFGGVPVFLHQDDLPRLMRRDPVVTFWRGERRQLHDGITLAHTGDYLDGGTLLHWPRGAAGKGVLLTGDVVQVAQDQHHVSFLSSSFDLTPRSASAANKILEAIEPFRYDRLYDSWSDHGITRNAREIVTRSFGRYIAAVSPR